MEFSLDGGSTFFITTDDPININDISIAPSGDGLLCQSENEIPGDPGSRHWYINPEMESTAMEDRITDVDDDSGWVRGRVTLSNNIQQAIMRRQSASGSVEGVFTCQLTLDIINPIRSLYILYPSESYYNNIITNTTKYNIIVLFVKYIIERYYNNMMVCHLFYSLSDC